MTDFYVYSYLREDGTPYYVGKGQGNRAYDPHPQGAVNLLPKDRSRIVMVQENMSEVCALTLEKILIAKYGRKIDGGILTNRTDGGEGGCGNTRKPIKVFCKFSGALIGRYPSVRVAAYKLGMTEPSMRSCAERTYKSIKNYIIRYEGDDMTDIRKLILENNKIVIYDVINSKVIDIVGYQKDAVRITGVKSSNIQRILSLNTKKKVFGNYTFVYFTFGWKDQINRNIYEYMNGSHLDRVSLRKPVDAYNRSGELIGTFNSAKECANVLGVTVVQISERCLRKKQWTRSGLTFRFRGDDI